MTFPINVNIPAANNDPADDQPEMLKNNANIAGYLAVDHIAPGTSGDGFHKRVTYHLETPPIGPPIDPESVEYTDVGIRDATHPQLYWQNSQGRFPQSAIRSFGVFNTQAANGAVPLINGINVASISKATAGVKDVYTVTLTANAVKGGAGQVATAFVQASGEPSLNPVPAYVMDNNVLTITFSLHVAAGRSVSFQVLEI